MFPKYPFALGGEFAVSSYTSGNFDEFPSVTTDASGNFVVAWKHDYGVVGRQFNDPEPSTGSARIEGNLIDNY